MTLCRKAHKTLAPFMCVFRYCIGMRLSRKCMHFVDSEYWIGTGAAVTMWSFMTVATFILPHHNESVSSQIMGIRAQKQNSFPNETVISEGCKRKCVERSQLPLLCMSFEMKGRCLLRHILNKKSLVYRNSNTMPVELKRYIIIYKYF